MMPFNRRAHAISMAALAALGTAGHLPADTSTVLLQTGVTNSPGAGGGVFNSILDAPAINSSGQIAILAGITGSNNGTTSMMVIRWSRCVPPSWVTLTWTAW